jgi:hypothetical protein
VRSQPSKVRCDAKLQFSNRRAEALIEETREVSLSAIAAKAEEVERLQKAAEDQRQVELNKRMLEAQLTQNDFDLGGNFEFNIYNQKEKLPPITEVSRGDSDLTINLSIGVFDPKAPSNQQPTVEEQPADDELWNQPEQIETVTSLLADCESIEMLAELRECAIPTSILKTAVKGLDATKREQIRDWVLKLNS